MHFGVWSMKNQGAEVIMLRKRSRSLQKDQYKGHLMPDCASESGFQSDVSEQKHKGSSFFRVPDLFVGFCSKGLSDSESARSPTSPLDYRVFSNIGNPFRSPRSCLDGRQKSWGCSKVGLSIVDSLNDESKPSGKVFQSSESRNILFGSQLKVSIPSPQSHLNGSPDSFASPRSLPKSLLTLPHPEAKSPHFQMYNSEIVFGDGEMQFGVETVGKNRSCLSDSGRSSPSYDFSMSPSPQTSLTNAEDFCSDQKSTQLGSPSVISGEKNLDNCLSKKPSLGNSFGMKPSSLPISIGSGHEFMASLSASEIELSEDYTCVISHGPNPRTTHIFGDCILECHTKESTSCKKEKLEIESPCVDKCLDGPVMYPSNDFLSFCYSCKKKLDEKKDIYMYRGEKAFCSFICRSQEILIEEEMEKNINNSSECSPESTSPEEIFLSGMVVAIQ
ncbi:PREDICTED: uncharacterized protein LOC104595233 isoform X1 [Nelumbo nucifera]|uniref:Uncharacterized protein LOC104595233 isoform X1 n=2 Tax=Nelumbo nucifera TaxID=4432 RepID=A0A1U7ZJM8_NELNU|nr:PREDICTED: uncharacterized protein LOC104595233 isoform X1 [Nelumbo nucifera]